MTNKILSPVFTEGLFKLLCSVVSFKVCFCHGFHIPRTSLPCTLADIRAAEILLDVDREKTSTRGFLAAEPPLSVAGINLNPAH